MYDNTPAAHSIVSRVFDLLSGAEAARMMSSLEIDGTEPPAIRRALRTLHRTRMSAEAATYAVVDAQLAVIEALVLTPEPVRANAHIAAPEAPASVLTSWFATAHVDSAPLVFRTRVESPVL